MLKAVLFDMDQTLVDWDHIQDSWDTYILRRLQGIFSYIRSDVHSMDDVTIDDAIEAYMLSLNNAWTTGLITLKPPHIKRVLVETFNTCGVPVDQLDADELWQRYEQDWQMPVGERAYPDVIEVLPQIEQQGIEMGIITNASHPMDHRDRELEAFGILGYFPRCRLSAADVGYLKPHEAIYQRALEILNLQPDEVVMVGDNLEADVGGAQGVGMRGVWRVNNARQQVQQNVLDIDPDGTISTLHELLELLDEWYPEWRNGHQP